LPIERLSLNRAAPRAEPASPEAPFVLTLAGAGGERLYALSPEAEQAGLAPGLGVADARALAPRLRAHAADPGGDRRSLTRLARWCGRFSPWTAADPGAPGRDGVLLDITGCARVFGGEDRLLSSLLSQARALGLTAHLAAAPTIGLAWGLARFEAPHAPSGLACADSVRGRLQALPVDALRIGETAASLRRFGLRTVGDLYALPRADLARRFGSALVRRLDQASGAEREALDPLQPPVRHRARVRFAEPHQTLDGVTDAARQALEGLCGSLRKAGEGAGRVRLTLYRVDGQARELVLGAARAQADPEHWSRLAQTRLERAEIDIGFGVDMVEASALVARRLEPLQADMASDAPAREHAFVRLSDRLAARLGPGAVRRPVFAESHLPERAAGWAGLEAQPASAPVLAKRRRPLLILDRPEPAQAVAEIPDGPPRQFTWRRVRHRVARAEGPERLAPEWWRARPGESAGLTRDYFHVETEAGRRFWLYREGLYGRETERPAWFVHGAG